MKASESIREKGNQKKTHESAQNQFPCSKFQSMRKIKLSEFRSGFKQILCINLTIYICICNSPLCVQAYCIPWWCGSGHFNVIASPSIGLIMVVDSFWSMWKSPLLTAANWKSKWETKYKIQLFWIGHQTTFRCSIFRCLNVRKQIPDFHNKLTRPISADSWLLFFARTRISLYRRAQFSNLLLFRFIFI